jgi:hypothetical protein
MKIVTAVLCAVIAVGCACKSKPASGTTGPGTGSGTGTGANDVRACLTIESHVRELYQASAERTKMTDEEVGDNVAMVVASCKEAPTRIVACVGKATAVAQLESQCLPALDDDGSEGQQFAK